MRCDGSHLELTAVEQGAVEGPKLDPSVGGDGDGLGARREREREDASVELDPRQLLAGGQSDQLHAGAHIGRVGQLPRARAVGLEHASEALGVGGGLDGGAGAGVPEHQRAVGQHDQLAAKEQPLGPRSADEVVAKARLEQPDPRALPPIEELEPIDEAVTIGAKAKREALAGDGALGGLVRVPNLDDTSGEGADVAGARAPCDAPVRALEDPGFDTPEHARRARARDQQGVGARRLDDPVDRPIKGVLLSQLQAQLSALEHPQEPACALVDPAVGEHRAPVAADLGLSVSVLGPINGVRAEAGANPRRVLALEQTRVGLGLDHGRAARLLFQHPGDPVPRDAARLGVRARKLELEPLLGCKADHGPFRALPARIITKYGNERGIGGDRPARLGPGSKAVEDALPARASTRELGDVQGSGVEICGRELWARRPHGPLDLRDSGDLGPDELGMRVEQAVELELVEQHRHSLVEGARSRSVTERDQTRHAGNLADPRSQTTGGRGLGKPFWWRAEHTSSRSTRGRKPDLKITPGAQAVASRPPSSLAFL